MRQEGEKEEESAEKKMVVCVCFPRAESINEMEESVKTSVCALGVSHW